MPYESTVNYTTMGSSGGLTGTHSTTLGSPTTSGTLSEMDNNTLSSGETFTIDGVEYTYRGTGTVQPQRTILISDYDGQSIQTENLGPPLEVVVAQDSSGNWIYIYPSGNPPALTTQVLTSASPTDWNTEGTFICFVSGTMIMTSEGERAIEELKVGDSVLTVDNGYKEITWIGKTQLGYNNEALRQVMRPIHIPQNALGKGLPKQDLRVSPQHRILLNSSVAGRMVGSDEVLVAAKHLVGISGITVATDAQEVEYWHMLFDQHELVYSNSVPSESLFTGPEALKSVGEEAREEISTLFPELVNQHLDDTSIKTIRPTLNGKVSKRLVMRHVRNDKPLSTLPLV